MTGPPIKHSGVTGLLQMNTLLNLLGKFHKAHLLVVGDLMLDHFIWGDVERISPEAPVPVLRITSESSRLGGAANVIHNIRSLGGKVTVCGVIGRDAAGKQLLEGLRRIRVSTQGVFSSDHCQTIQKSRIIARPRHQQIVRLDRESHGDLREIIRRKIREFVFRRAPRCDGLVVSDYGKGVIHEALLADIADMAGKRKIVCVIDPKRENYSRYRLPTLITPNKEEAGEAAGIDIRDEA
ncbi:MAG TPA: PfkB family carbohydrate kinase, partial [Candidatus Binatia bacterium]|nr:PfkB family carbohydrate kinase [Candidatus Binatia bacterium]